MSTIREHPTRTERTAGDPYTTGQSAVRAPPSDWRERLRWLGPSVVISGSIIGSGELVLTSSLGASAGFTLLWWVLVSCWSKSLVQAEFARYVVVSGDTYLRALNRVPGRLRLSGHPVSWTLYISLLSFIPGVIGMGGILGGAGQALTLLVPAADASLTTMLLALVTSAILYSGSYVRLERLMLAMVAAFTAATLASVIAMQFTPFRVTWLDLVQGMQFRFPSEFLVLGLAMYGATGVNSAEISTYSYWCIEKGYAGYIGGEASDPERVQRARGWVRVLQLDVWITLAILTCATLPFYLLGAGVLHATGQNPQGLDTVRVLSEMFTQTLGHGSLWLFGGAAFCILFSSVVAGYGGSARLLPDYLIEFGLFDRGKLQTRQAWTRAYGVLAPVIGLGAYLLVRDPLTLLRIGALAGALLLPVQSGSTLWLQRTRMDTNMKPSATTHLALWITFAFQALLAVLVIRYVVFATF